MPTVSACPAFADIDQVDNLARPATDLRRDALADVAAALAQGQHDRADHRDQQNQSRRLKQAGRSGSYSNCPMRIGVRYRRRASRRRAHRPSATTSGPRE